MWWRSPWCPPPCCSASGPPGSTSTTSTWWPARGGWTMRTGSRMSNLTVHMTVLQRVQRTPTCCAWWPSVGSRPSPASPTGTASRPSPASCPAETTRPALSRFSTLTHPYHTLTLVHHQLRERGLPRDGCLQYQQGRVYQAEGWVLECVAGSHLLHRRGAGVHVWYEGTICREGVDWGANIGNLVHRQV